MTHQAAGLGDPADLFARVPFKPAAWAGYEKHRQHQQRSRKKREKKRSPKAHPTMRTAKSCKQARDDIGEDDCCHDLTAGN